MILSRSGPGKRASHLSERRQPSARLFVPSSPIGRPGALSMLIKRLFRRSVPAGCPTGAPRRLLRPDHPTGTTQWKASRVRCGRCYRFGYLSSVLKFRIIEAAEILGVSDDTVRRWIDNGQLLVERDQSRRIGHRRSGEGKQLTSSSRTGDSAKRYTGQRIPL